MTDQWQLVIRIGVAGDGLGDTFTEAQANSQAELIIDNLEDQLDGIDLVLVRDGGQRFTVNRWES